MTQGVSRLKEILFETEARRIESLSRDLELHAREVQNAEVRLSHRIDTIHGETRGLHAELGLRLEKVFEQAETRERFEKSVATVLDGAFREAEISRHRQLSQAMAPLLVKTIKSEISNSRDEMVEALYPITGRLVKAYVANAVKDMMADINRRLETRLPGSRVMLQLKSYLTGRPVAELALAETQNLEVEELFLIRRGSGDLVGHWERAGGSDQPTGRDAMVSGLLTAITSFAETAFEDDPESLRRLERETDCIYLRATPAYLLAARCGGTAAAAVEQVVDNQLLHALENRHFPEAAQEDGVDSPALSGIASVLPGLAAKLDLAIAEKQAELRPSRSGFGPLYTIATLVLLPILGWLGWQAYGNYRLSEVRGTTRAVIAEIPELKGYPIVLEVDRRGALLALSGLVPSTEGRNALLTRLREKLPSTEITDELSPLPAVAQVDLDGPLTSLRSETDQRLQRAEAAAQLAAKAAVSRLSQRAFLEAAGVAGKRLAEVQPALARLSGSADKPKRDAYVGAQETLSALVRELNELARSEASATLVSRDALAATFSNYVQLIEALNAALTPAQETSSAAGTTALTSAGTASPVALQLPLAAERLAVTLSRLEESTRRELLERELAELRRAAGLSPRQKLMEWSRAHAFFFGNGTDYRNERQAEQLLDSLAALIGAVPDITIRLVGFTDERGQVPRNATLAQQRAEKVLAGLASRGVPRSRLISFGRPAGPDISTEVGPTSPNRRVEIELGYVDENVVTR